MKTEIPIVCSLTNKELQLRRRNYLDKASERLVQTNELGDGFRFQFPLDDSILQLLAEIIELERRCCPFLNFRLEIEAGKDFVMLDLTGATGTKETIRELFGWS